MPFFNPAGPSGGTCCLPSNQACIIHGSTQQNYESTRFGDRFNAPLLGDGSDRDQTIDNKCLRIINAYCW